MGHSEVVRVMLLRGAERDAARDVSATSACALSAVLCFLVCFEAARLPGGVAQCPQSLFCLPGCKAWALFLPAPGRTSWNKRMDRENEDVHIKER